jgi:hypothetical protein
MAPRIWTLAQRIGWKNGHGTLLDWSGCLKRFRSPGQADLARGAPRL